MPATMSATMPAPVIAAAQPAGLPPGHQAAIDAINQARISRPVRCTARRLLDRASPDGVCVVPRSALLELCDTPYADTVRHHLAQLKKAGLIHCSVRDVAFIQFIACTAQPQPSRPAPATATPTAERTAPPAAPIAQPKPARANTTPAPERQPRSPAPLPGTYRADTHYAPQPTQHTAPPTAYAAPRTEYAPPPTDPPPPSAAGISAASVIAATGRNLNWDRRSSQPSATDSDAPDSDATAAICGLLADFHGDYPLCRRLALRVPVPVVEEHVRDYRARVAAGEPVPPEILLDRLRALLA